jgi:hypothetical protein
MGNIIDNCLVCLLSDGLFGQTRQVVLALLDGMTGSSFYTKQILGVGKIG